MQQIKVEEAKEEWETKMVWILTVRQENGEYQGYLTLWGPSYIKAQKKKSMFSKQPVSVIPLLSYHHGN